MVKRRAKHPACQQAFPLVVNNIKGNRPGSIEFTLRGHGFVWSPLEGAKSVLSDPGVGGVMEYWSTGAMVLN